MHNYLEEQEDIQRLIDRESELNCLMFMRQTSIEEQNVPAITSTILPMCSATMNSSAVYDPVVASICLDRITCLFGINIKDQ